MAALHPRRLLLPMLLLAILVVSMAALAGWPVARAQEAEAVEDLRGSIQAVEGEVYAHELSATDGQSYALLGESPAIEEQLAQLARERAAVSISGTLQRQSALSTLPLVVVGSVRMLSAEPDPPAATPDPFARPTQLPGGIPTIITLDPIEQPGMLPTLLPDDKPDAPATPLPTLPPTAALTLTPAPAVTATPTVTATAEPPTQTPAPTAAPGLPATVRVYALYLRKGPGSDYASAGTVEGGTLCLATARSFDAEWLQVECPDGPGWLRASMVELDGEALSLPVVEVPPPDTAAPDAPTPTPAPIVWRALVYPNRDLKGAPVVGFDTPAIDFDWGQGAPVQGIPVDNFSVRFDSAIQFAPGDYLFTVAYDDGIRLIVNGEVVISDWTDGPLRASAWRGRLAGTIPVRLEFFEAYYDARVRLEIARLATQPLPTPGMMPTAVSTPLSPPAPLPQEEWLAGYFTNPDATGAPILVRTELADDTLDPTAPPVITARTPLSREFGLTSPSATLIGLDGWSARWQGQFNFAGGPHLFEAVGLGEANVYIDGILVLSGALGPAGAPGGESVNLAAGIHEVTVEFFDREGPARIRVAWQALDAAVGIQPVPTATPPFPEPVPTATPHPQPGLPPAEPATPLPAPGDAPTATPFPVGK